MQDIKFDVDAIKWSQPAKPIPTKEMVDLLRTISEVGQPVEEYAKEHNRHISSIVSEVIRKQEVAFEELAREVFGDGLPEEGKWCRVSVQDRPDIVALVPSDKIDGLTLDDILRDYPHKIVDLSPLQMFVARPDFMR